MLLVLITAVVMLLPLLTAVVLLPILRAWLLLPLLLVQFVVMLPLRPLPMPLASLRHRPGGQS